MDNMVAPALSGSSDFLNNNTLITKFAVLLLAIILFVVGLRVGISFLTWLFSPKKDPILIDGMIDSKQMAVIPQNPATKGAIPVLRSVNDPNGMELTWSVWIYIDDFSYKRDEFKHVFHKGNDDINVTDKPVGMNEPNNAPGLYITPVTNDIVVVMNTFERINEDVTVKDIPLNKWVNIIIRLDQQHNLDIYINGTMKKRHVLAGVPKQNYDDVYVSMNGGFSGYTSSLRYFNKAIGNNEILSIVKKGPNLKMKSSDAMKKPSNNYISTQWYFSDINAN